MNHIITETNPEESHVAGAIYTDGDDYFILTTDGAAYKSWATHSIKTGRTLRPNCSTPEDAVKGLVLHKRSVTLTIS